MPHTYHGGRHEPEKENASSFIPKHDHHRCSKRGGTSNRFPSRDYIEDKASCGTNYLEVDGLYGFVHVRCPCASRIPCSCGRHSLHIDSLVVAVDGACPGNGTQLADKSACGVFFAPGSTENFAFRVSDDPGYAHTNQRAELHAAIAAIIASQRYIYNGGQWNCQGCPVPCPVAHLVIKSDSAYLVNGMTAHVEKWQQNGWRTAKGAEVKNQDLWTQLVDLVRYLYEITGVAIDFWHVPRDQNGDADKLANLGLEQHW
ncbi:ribonuclease H-like protein [Xylaria venustula]|nr:ribonuclease H-like protein [Xylaria venustula]